MRKNNLQTYRYIFYRIYAWGLRTHGAGDLPEYNAIFGLSMLFAINVMSALILSGAVAFQPADNIGLKWVSVSTWLLALVVHFLFLVRGGQAQKITEEFEGESVTGTQAMMVWIYPIGSLVIFFGLISVRWYC